MRTGVDVGARPTRRPGIVLALAASTLVVSLLAFADPTDPLTGARTPTDTEKDTFVRQVMREAGIPGLQVVVVKNGRVVWKRSLGFAVLAQPGPPTPMRDDSVLFTCSVGKMLTAVAILQQVEQGHLSLDDDVNRYVPFVVRNPKWPDVPITWRMLLTHTSSISIDQSVEDSVYFYGSDSPVTLEEYVEGTFRPGGRYYRPDSYLPERPGTHRAYSDNAVDLAGYALARLVHEPFADYITRVVLVPLRMEGSSYSLRTLPVGKLAVGYGRTVDRGDRWSFLPARVAFAHLPAGRTVMDEQMGVPDPPAGGLFTSAIQYSRLVLMLLGRGSLDGVKVLEPSSVDQLLTHSGSWSSYGYQQGLVLLGTRDLDDHLVWGHDGQDRGFCAAVNFDPESGVGAIAFANANREDGLLSRRLVDLEMHLMGWFK